MNTPGSWPGYVIARASMAVAPTTRIRSPAAAIAAAFEAAGPVLVRTVVFPRNPAMSETAIPARIVSPGTVTYR